MTKKRKIILIAIFMVSIIGTIIGANIMVNQSKPVTEREIVTVRVNAKSTLDEVYPYEDMSIKFNKNAKLNLNPEYMYISINQNAYFVKNSVSKDAPFKDGKDLTKYKKYDKITITGINARQYLEAKTKNGIVYINQSDVVFDKKIVDKMQAAEKAEAKRKAAEKKAEAERKKEEAEAKKKAEEEAKAEESSTNDDSENNEDSNDESSSSSHESASGSWDGSKLTASMGVNYGPQGKETYYNLPMGGVVSIMRGMGFDESEYPYWEREDGCKMLGPYIMVAANLDVFPRGSTVECSLGMALVCDTGGFAYDNPYQLDIATNW